LNADSAQGRIAPEELASMGDGLRTIHVVTSDESLIASARAAAEALEGWEVAARADAEQLLAAAPAGGDVILLDAWARGKNVYEACRALSSATRCRLFVVVQRGAREAEPIARFCGATGILERPLVPSRLREALARGQGPRPALPAEARGRGVGGIAPEQLLAALSGKAEDNLVSALTDPETGLFNFAFLSYKLDEEHKRAQRFGMPLSCVLLGFEGEVEPAVLRELASIFLESSRDTDVLGRFDQSSFLFLLPNTGPDGAAVMGRRVGEQAQARGLSDLVGDPLAISVGISSCPHPEVARREDLFSRAREAFLEARAEGGGVVAAT
jgi:diguanylate cyclase (GGDEF)-like protein